MQTQNITVIGVGKLGLGFALLLERVGYNVLGVDIFPEYVQKLNNKSIQFAEPGYNDLIQNSKNFKATLSLEEGLNFSDIIFIIVQTPNGGGDRFYDHSILSNLLSRINDLLLSLLIFVITLLFAIITHYSLIITDFKLLLRIIVTLLHYYYVLC